MDFIWESITEWLKEVLVGGIMDHLSGMFDAVNQQVGDVATQVGTSPANFSPGVFSMIRNVSESVIIPIAGIILTIIACYELIQMIIDHNNLANFETWIFFKWVFKTFVAVMLITNCFNITMAVFDVCQNVINGAGGLISDTTAIDGAALETLEETLMEMDIGPLIGLFLQSFLLNVTMWALSIIIFIIVYDDIKAKLIARGVPAEEIAFIHDADNEVKKKELFAKVRTGQVRVLLGSTQKMGAGTNCQDLLVAVHHLDVGWRPSDMTQRNGRIIRQGNRNKEVQIYQYVTESTFDAYLYQTLENKQKFISQIMTSKSPVRACDDVDEQALSYAEIKALCAGDSRIKEKMDLDIDVARLKVLKSDHQSQQYRLEDRLLKYFPAEMEKQRGFIQGFEADMQTVTAHPLPKEGFVGAEIQGRTFSEKELAGEAILAACKSYTGMEPVALGTYRGFSMELSYNSLSQEYEIALKGSMTHTVTLGTDARGNFTRMDNTLAGLEGRKEKAQVQLENMHNQQEAAKAELGKPFPQEAELAEKSTRLAELDAALNMDDHGVEEEVTEPEGRSSVLADLKAKAAMVGEAPKRYTEREEVR